MKSNSRQARPASSRDAATRTEPTRDLILKAAARIFRSKGYAATTLRAIAAELGIKAGSIYYHFSSKDEIIDEVMDIGLRTVQMEVEAAVTALGERASLRERLEMAVRTHLTAVVLRADFSSTNIRVHYQLPAEIRRKHDQIRSEYGEYWNGLLRDAQDTGGLRRDLGVVPIRQFIFGAMNWNVEWFDPEHYSVEVLADRCVQLLFDGIWSKNAPMAAGDALKRPAAARLSRAN